MRPGRQHESKWKFTCRLGSGSDALHCKIEVIEWNIGISSRVLDRAADKSRIRSHANGLRDDLWFPAETILQVGRNRQIRRLDNHSSMLKCLVARQVAIAPAHRACRRGARRG